MEVRPMQKAEPTAEAAEKDMAVEMKAKVEETEAEAGEIRVEFEETGAEAEAIKAKAEEIKAGIAEKVREESRERTALTPEIIIAGLDNDLRYGRIDIRAILAEMGSEEQYRDIKAITTTTGMLFAYSDTYITPDNAAAKSVVEEAKLLLAGAIRADSLEKALLTPVSDIYAMAPDTEPAIIDVLLRGMQTEERFADIKKVAAANGDVYYHSDNYLVDSYAVTLLMSMAGNHCATIAETVREESRTYPRTTNVAIFGAQGVYNIPADDLDAIILETVRKPEYSDIKRIVHPSTGAVHLYSDRYIEEARAWAMMDWEEVGRANNP
jgi:hypothetical protein